MRKLKYSSLLAELAEHAESVVNGEWDNTDDTAEAWALQLRREYDPRSVRRVSELFGRAPDAPAARTKVWRNHRPPHVTCKLKSRWD